ncbi:MAG: chemotaxis protein CheW [Planctomycetia bacterium]|nr:chemotaxis protein CheW [Planctomycetia bacterium]
MKTNGKTDLRQQTDKFLMFTLGNEHYGVEILQVLEIVGMLEITPVPRTPHYVLGVANLRGKIIPVVDLKRKFDMPSGEVTAQTCIVVVRTGRFEAGLLVDRVLEVAAIPADMIEDTPCFGNDVEADFIQGLAKSDQAVTILLNLDRVLVDQDFARVQDAQESDHQALHTEAIAR